MAIVIGDAMLEARWYGSLPSAQSIVMLHEGLGSVSTWKDFPERLSKTANMAIFAYSRPGHGQSSPALSPRPLNAMHSEARERLPLILDAIGFKQGVLLGHSDGASIVTIYAGSVQDDRVRGLILIEPHFNVEEKNLNSIRKVKASYRSTDLRTRLARHHARVDDLFAAWSGTWLHPDFSSFDITDELSRIRVPMLILKSKDDPYSTMLQVELAQAKSRGSVESVVVEGDDHSPHRSHPTKALDAIKKFVNRVCRNSAVG